MSMVDQLDTRFDGMISERSFDDLPPEMIVRAFGVDYAHITPAGDVRSFL